MKLSNIILLLLGLGVLVYILARMDVDMLKVIESVKSPYYAFLASLIYIAMPYFNALRMKFIINPIEKKIPSVHDLFAIEYIYKFLSNVMPFKLNVPAKAVLLSKKCGMKLSSGASTVSFEYALDSGITIAFGFLGVIAYFRDDPRISFMSIQYFILIALAGSMVFFSIPAHYFETVISYVENLKIEVMKRIVIFLVKAMAAIRAAWIRILLDKRMFWVLLTTILIWGGAVLVNMLLFKSVGVYVPPTWILVVVSVGIFVGGISTIPGGLGVREAAMIVLYGALGVPTEASVANALMGRLMTLVFVLIGYTASIRAGMELLEEKSV